MEWIELKNGVYNWDGFCRDIYVLGTNRADWLKWINYINKHYSLTWFNGKAGRDEHKIDFAVIKEFWSGNYDLCSTAKVYIGNIQINAHFFNEKVIENDIDPRVFNSIKDHNRLMDYMSCLSILLNKVVILTPENQYNKVLIEATKKNIKYF